MTASTCMPHPLQVILRQLGQTAGLHMVYSDHEGDARRSGYPPGYTCEGGLVSSCARRPGGRPDEEGVVPLIGKRRAGTGSDGGDPGPRCRDRAEPAPPAAGRDQGAPGGARSAHDPVLRPGGRLLVLEHVLSARPARARWQNALQGPWRAMGGRWPSRPRVGDRRHRVSGPNGRGALAAVRVAQDSSGRQISPRRTAARVRNARSVTRTVRTARAVHPSTR